MCGRDLEKLLGHLSFLCLIRHESLCVFERTYTFVQRHYLQEASLWPSVRRELERWGGIAPLLQANLTLPWSMSVHFVDASPWGMGACPAEFSEEEVRSLGQISERWRSKMPSAPGAPPPSQPWRLAAFESGEMAPPTPPPADESERADETGPFERRPAAEWSGVQRSVMEKRW